MAGVVDTNGNAVLAQVILDEWPGLNMNQAAVLAAATRTPFITGAAKAAGVGIVTVYGWLGRFPKEQSRKSEAFCEAWPIFASIGENAYLVRAMEMSESLTEKGAAAAAGVMTRFVQGFDGRFGGQQAVQLDTHKVKRIILEREEEKK